MTYAHEALAALTIDPSAGPIFEDGDVAVILKADGSVKAVSAGLDTSRLSSVPVEEWTDADHRAYEQGEKLMAVTLACNNPQLMEIMLAVANEPAVQEQLAALTIRH